MASFWALSDCIIAPSALFDRSEISAYEEEILGNPNTTEHDASRFFQEHSKFLLLGEGKNLRREVVFLDPINHKASRVDFFRQSYGRRDWDIIEIKSPRVPFVVNAGDIHPNTSAQVQRAMTQAENYRDKIIEHSDIRAQLLKRGIIARRPRMLVVVGQVAEEISDNVLDVLKDRIRRGPVEAWSYTDILNFAKDHYESNRILVWAQPDDTQLPRPPIDRHTMRRRQRSLFIDSYSRILDHSGRLRIPPAFLNVLHDEDAVYVLPGFRQGTISILPEAELLESVKAVKDWEVDDALEFEQIFYALAHRIEIQRTRASARITIPKELLRQAQIQSHVVVAGAGGRIDVWDKSTYERWMSHFSMSWPELQQFLRRPGSSKK